MKTRFILIVVMTTMFLNMNLEAKENNKETVTFKVNMHCESCKQKIEKNISFEKGVTALQIDLGENIVTITFKSNKNSEEGIKSAIEKLGYKVEVLKDYIHKKCCNRF